MIGCMVSLQVSITRLLDKKVVLGLNGTTKEDVIRELISELVRRDKLKGEEEFLERILNREKLISTGLGFGIAIPHIRTGLVDEPHLIAGISYKGVEFDAADGRPVQILFLLIAPKNHSEYNIGVLSTLARILKDEATRRNLLMADSVEEFINYIQEAEDNLTR